MIVAVALIMGLVGGLIVKALFLKESNLVFDAVFGIIGGGAGYALFKYLHNADVVRAIFALGIAVVVAGVLHEAWTRLGGKTA